MYLLAAPNRFSKNSQVTKQSLTLPAPFTISLSTKFNPLHFTSYLFVPIYHIIMTLITPNGKEPKKPEIEYPCQWSYKVIGHDCTLLKNIIVSACNPLEVTIHHSHSSSGGKYHSLEARLVVPSEEVRLDIYEKIRSDPAVKIVL